MEHQAIWPSILYFGTPVALVTTINVDGTSNIGPMSSAWALGYTVVMGWESTAHTLANLQRERECVINLPGPRKFQAADLTPTAAETVKPPRIAECPLQLEATVTAIHEPASRPDGEFFWIVETHVQRVHALASIVKPETNHIDPQHWSPLLYVFRHYFATGQEIARSFRAED